MLKITNKKSLLDLGAEIGFKLKCYVCQKYKNIKSRVKKPRTASSQKAIMKITQIDLTIVQSF